MMKLLDETTALDAIRTLLAEADHARLAVAFWGKGAISRLGLDRPGLSLEILCNLDSGACNPAELRRLLDLPGIELRSHPALHAKVYWTAGGAVLGSSNASANGLALESDAATGWHEANISIADPQVLADIDRRFTDLFTAGYPVGTDDLDRAALIWKARARQAPTGRRLASSLFEAWRTAPRHAIWKRVKVVWWREDLPPEDQAWIDGEIADGRLDSEVGAYEGWNEHIASGDLLIDFDVSGRKPKYSGSWKAVPGGGRERLRLVLPVARLALQPLGQFPVSEQEQAALAAIAAAAVAKHGDGEGNAIVGFGDAMALIGEQAGPSRGRAFDRAMQHIYDEATTFGYRPTYFLKMLAEHGGVETARRLIRGTATSGFQTLWKHSRLDLSVEALILQPQWRELFSDEEAKIARRRLKDFDYVSDSKPAGGT
ncbi:phospholipase D family protein [Sphingomonas koreensis]